MDVPMIVARVLHIGLGVFWAGTLVFNAIFLLPAMREAGPEGAKVAAGLMRRRFVDVMPAVAIVTVLSGFYLYWRVSAGFAPDYMGSPTGMVIGTGSVAALVAMVIGIGILRPAMLRATALSQDAGAAAAAEERDRLLATAQQLRSRAGRAARAVAWLLGIAVVTMAVARYV